MRELHLHVVEHLVAIRAVDEDAQVEVLVTEGVGPTEGELGQRRTDVGAVVLVDDTVTVHVLILHVANPNGGVLREHAVAGILLGLRRGLDILERGVNTVGLIAVEVEQALAHVGHADHVGPLTVAHDLGIVGTVKSDKFILVERNLSLRIPLKRANDGVSGQGDFDTSVADVAIVAHGSGQGRRCITRGAHVRRQLQVHQHVLRLLAIPVNNQADAVVQEAQVETDVELLLLLPLHTLVGKVLGLVARAQRRLDHSDGGAPEVTTDVGVTSLTPTQTQLTVGEPIHVLHELLVGKAPRTGERVEASPAVRGTEVGATVIAVGVGRIVTVIEAVSPTGEERSHRRAAKAVVDLGRALTQLGIVNLVRRQVGVGYTRVVIFRLPALLTKHGGQVVTVGYGLGVGQVVLQLPEGA